MDLHIFCGPSTTFADSLALDIPSICLWNPACLEPRAVYRNLYTELKQAGIIVTNADSFSTVLKKRLGSDEWWSKETQLVRRKFCENMAFSSDEWISINNSAILEVTQTNG
jgi:putative transferase (TIGR04331 family)